MKTPVSVLALLTKLFPNANLEHSISCRFPFYLLMSLVIGHFWLFISYDALNMKDSLPRFVKNIRKSLKGGVFKRCELIRRVVETLPWFQPVINPLIFIFFGTICGPIPMQCSLSEFLQFYIF